MQCANPTALTDVYRKPLFLFNKLAFVFKNMGWLSLP